MLVLSEGVCEVLGGGMVCKDEDKDDGEEDEKGEEEKDNEGESSDEFVVGGIGSDDHEGGEVGLEEEGGVHCQWRRVDNEWEWEG